MSRMTCAPLLSSTAYRLPTTVYLLLLPREHAVHRGGVVDEGGDDDGGLLEVLGDGAVVVVLVGVPGARAVLDLVLKEVDADEAGGVEGEEVRPARVVDGDGRRRVGRVADLHLREGR